MKKDYWNYARYANFALSFGITMALSIFLGLYGGSWLDKRLGTSPWFLLTGILLGVAVSFKALLSELMVLQKTEDTIPEDDNEKEE
ncbi:AtpZ/AtpI family protein [Metallumcola ferriviriculae]|uniref:AtpZ/AtpI family protein n=1 Tax=Metallumcola ferriviriculae TaxID=3039180 RepID=A0AAU0UHQ0_9FIRM|nr:AtpZ/AtpI family protein [Desulfitibacteraceae bacterium MK1]